MKLIRWLLADFEIPLPRWVMGCLLVCWLAVMVNEVDAHASPLTVHAHQANLYGGKLAISRVCIDLKIRKPVKAVLEVEGIGGGSETIHGYPGYWPAYRTFHLKPGYRRFCRAFFVRHWVIDTVPDRAGLPRSKWTTFDATEVQSVFASLTIGTRLWEAEGVAFSQNENAPAALATPRGRPTERRFR